MKSSVISPAVGFGCRIDGLGARDIVDPKVRQELRDLWIEHGLLLFRGGDHDPDFQVDLSRCFGELQEHSVKEMLHPTRKEMLVLRGEPGAAAVMDVNGVELAGFIPWHSDQIFTAEINHGGILAVEVQPEVGGNTGFIDRIEAYDALPNAMKTRIAGLEVAYRLHTGDGNFRFLPYQAVRMTQRGPFQDGIDERIAKGAFPTVVHPLVYMQPETGRKVLNFSPMFASHVLGLPRDESDALLWEIAKHITDESRAYDHVWQPGDMLLWDNWRMIHTARGVPLGYRREGQRTTIAGDYALGRVLEGAVSN
jgi:taurine dioxygenase